MSKHKFTKSSPRAKPSAANGKEAKGGAHCSHGIISVFLSSIVLAAIAFVAYLPAIHAGFIWDDFQALHDNQFLRVPGGLWKIWSTHGLIPNESHYWPLVYTSYWLEYRLWGFSAAGFHAVNVLLHAANGILLWVLLRKMKMPGAWLAAALFLLHPVHVESVAWIHERKDVLSALFYLLAFLAFMRFAERRGRWEYTVAMVFFVCAMLCKSVVISFPLACAVWLWFRSERFHARDLLPVVPILIIAVAIGGIDTALAARTESYNSGFSLVDRLIFAGHAFWFYLGKLVMPTHLFPLYPKWKIDMESAWQCLPLLGAGILYAGLWFARKRTGKAPLAALLFYGITLGPALGMIDFAFMRHAYVADRFQYLASAGPIVFGAAMISKWLARRQANSRQWIGPMLLLAIFGALTYRQASLYENIETLFTYAVAHNPESPVARHNLAYALVQKGDLRRAAALEEKALATDPAYIASHDALGVIAGKQGDIAKAVRHYREALRLGRHSAKMLNDLSWYLATSPDTALRNSKEAVQYAEEANRLSLNGQPAMLDTLAAAYASDGRFDESIATAREAMRFAKAANDLALASEIGNRLKLYKSRHPFVELPSRKHD